jgi:homospermidine synthase
MAINKSAPANLVLNYLTPIVTADGNGVFIRDADNIPVVTFFQVRKNEGGNVYADAVAAVQLNSIDALLQLKEAIENTVKEHRIKEK